jgi:ubiquinone/menaquinone biosynthesis C-methylase UbiE
MDVGRMSVEELDQLGTTLEQHGRSAAALRLRRKYFSRLPWGGLNVLEIGCGTGVVTRALASQDGVESVVGVDPSAHFLERAKAQAGSGFLCSRPDSSPVEYVQGSAFDVPKPDESFDLVVFHETLAHVPSDKLDSALAEVKRLVKPGGMVSVYERDWLSFDCYQSQDDELRPINEFYMDAMVQDPYLMRKMPSLLEEAGFTMKLPLQLWVDVETDKGEGYMLAWHAINHACERGLIDATAKARLLDELENRSLVASVGHGHCAALKL